MLVRASKQVNYHQRDESIMAQGVLPFQYQDQKHVSGMTALDELPAYLDLAPASGVRDAICRHEHGRFSRHAPYLRLPVTMPQSYR